MKIIKNICLLVLVCINSAWAGTTPDEKAASMDYIKKLAADVYNIATTETDKTIQDQKVAQLLDNNLAYNNIAGFVLGRHWKTATPEEKAEFVKLYSESLRVAYSKQVLSVDLKNVDAYDAIISPTGQLVTVKTKIIDNESKQPVAVDWRITKIDNNFKIIDVLIEGISIASSQRSEYSSVIQRGGGKVEAVLEKLRKNLAKESGASDTKVN